MSEVIFHLKPSDPSKHIFQIRLLISKPQQQQILRLPAWIPGSYMIREFSKNIVQIKAFDTSGTIELKKLDKSTWLAQTSGQSLTVEYEVYAWDLSVRTAHLDQTHGYYNGTSVFLQADGFETTTQTIYIHPPTDEACTNWKVATTLPLCEETTNGFGRYEAANYDELIDHPVEMGTFDLYHFAPMNVPHELAITGRYRADTERITRDLTVICEYFMSFFGAPYPMERYLFQLMVTGSAYGGLEHRSSTSLICSRTDLPKPGETELSNGYRKFLGLCSHEYFHTWNVKRIKPAVFLPYNLRQESYTRTLWVFEGVTSYYDDLCLVRTGLISTKSYFELIGRTITRVRKSTGHTKHNLADSSFDAWIKLYRPDENNPNARISYYAKGSLAAIALDLHLRLHSHITLDHVMKELWKRNGEPLIGVEEDGFELLVNELSGVDLKPFFDQYIRGCNPTPLESLLPHFGVSLHTRPASKNHDLGGTKVNNIERIRRSGSLGVKFSKADGGVKLAHVYEGGAAQKAGLSALDVIVAIDNLKVNFTNIHQQVADYGAGTTLLVHAFRRDELREYRVTLQAPEEDTYYLQWMTDVTPAVEERRAKWLQISQS